MSAARLARLPPRVVEQIKSLVPAAHVAAAVSAGAVTSAVTAPTSPWPTASPQLASRLRVDMSTTTSVVKGVHRLLKQGSAVVDVCGGPSSSSASSSPPSALGLAHAHLNALPWHAATSSTGALLRRQRAYSALTRAMLSPSCPSPIVGLAAAQSLLSRQLAEGVPPSLASLTSLLRALTAHNAPTIATIQAVLPLLPAALDRHALTLIVASTIREAAPPPATVRAMVADCLGADARAWGWDIWDVVLSAHVPHGDFRGALACMAEMRRTLRAGKAGRAAPRSPAETVEIARPFTTLMALWVSTRFASHPARGKRLGSQFPAALARALRELVDVDTANLPAPFLVAWCNAERVAHNLVAAAGAFSHLIGISPAELATTLPAALPPAVKDRVNRLSDEAWVTLCKLYKLDPPASYRPLVAHVHRSASPAVIDALLSAIASTKRTVDLPLLLHLMQTHPRPTSRTIDVAAGAIVRASRAGSLHGLGNSQLKRDSVTAAEWEAVSRELHRIRLAHVPAAVTRHDACEAAPPATMYDAAPASSAAAISLPLGVPLATLDPTATSLTDAAAPAVMTHRQLYPAPPPVTSPGVTYAPTMLPRPADPSGASRPAGTVVVAGIAVVPPARIDAKAHALIGPLIELLKDAVVRAHRVHRGRRFTPAAAVLSHELGRVRDMCGRRARRWNKWKTRNV